MTNAELRKDRIRMAKRFFAEKDIKVFQKDIAAVERRGFEIPSQDGELFEHREIYIVTMKNGKTYAIKRETVNAFGEFSTASGKFKTTDIMEV